MEKSKTIVAKNDELMKNWNHEKNAGLNPDELTVDFQGRAWWKCPDCGHEWMSQISHRAKGHGCPNCHGKQHAETERTKTVQEKDFAEKHPELVKDWHPTKNEGLLPEIFSSASCESVWWLCPDCGSEWKTTISHRVKGLGCPKCGTKN